MKRIITILMLLVALKGFSAQQLIGLGATPNDHTGDPARVAGAKINANFTELYNGGLPVSLLSTNSALIGQGTNFFVVNAALAAAAGWPTNIAALVTLAQLTTTLQGVTNYVQFYANFLSTNTATKFDLTSATNLPLFAINGVGFLGQWSLHTTNEFASGVQLNAASNVLALAKQPISAILTSIAATGAFTNTVAGGTNVVLTTNGAVVSWNVTVPTSQTNGLATVSFVTNLVTTTSNGIIALIFSTTNGASIAYVNTLVNNSSNNIMAFVAQGLVNGTNNTLFVSNILSGISQAQATQAAKNATNGLPVFVWGLGSASQSNASAFVTPPQLTAATNTVAQNAQVFSLGIGSNGTNYANSVSNGAVAAATASSTAALTAFSGLVPTLSGNNSFSGLTNFFNNEIYANSLRVSGTTLFYVDSSGNLKANNINNHGSFSSDGASFSSDGLGNIRAVSFTGSGSGLTSLNLAPATNYTVQVSNSIVSVFTNSFVSRTNGQAQGMQITGNLRFGNWTNFNLTGNLIGSFGSTPVGYCNSTWEKASSTTWSNVVFSQWQIELSGRNYYMQSNGVSFFANTSLLGSWSLVTPFGSGTPPYTTDLGSYWNMNGTKFVGYVYSTNLTAQMINAVNTYGISSNEVVTLILANSSNPTNGVSATFVTNCILSFNYTTFSNLNSSILTLSNEFAGISGVTLVQVTNAATSVAIGIANNVQLGGYLIGTPTNALFNSVGLNVITNIAASVAGKVYSGTNDPNGLVAAPFGSFYNQFDVNSNFLYSLVNTNGLSGWQE